MQLDRCILAYLTIDDPIGEKLVVYTLLLSIVGIVAYVYLVTRERFIQRPLKVPRQPRPRVQGVQRPLTTTQLVLGPVAWGSEARI